VLHVPVTTSSQEHTTPQPSARRRELDVLAVLCFAALVIAYFWLVDAYGINTIRVDQWSDLALIERAYSGHLSFSALWAQHTDNRVLFPNLVVLLLAKTTQFNVLDEEFLSAVTLASATAVLIIGHRRWSPRAQLLFYVPVAIVMLSFAQNGNTLWGFQFAWYLVLLALGVSLALCDRPRWNWLILVGATLAAIVGSYSSLQGLLIWPAGLVVLLLRRRSPRFIVAWLATGGVTTAIYFVNYNSQPGGTSDGFALHHPLQGLRFFFFSVGNTIDAHGGNLAVVIGVLLVLTALWLVFLTLFRPRESEGSALGVGLICFGLLFTALITTGRAAAGLDAGGASRYTTFDLLTLVGCYLVLLDRRRLRDKNRRFGGILWYGSVVTVAAAVCLTLTLGTINGLDDATSWHDAELQASRVIANIAKAPDSMVERVLTVNPYYVPWTRRLVAFARVNRLTFFATSPTVARYVRAGLPYDARSLTTRIIAVKSDATVDGATWLIASAQSDFGIASVAFVISSSAGVRIRLTAIDTEYGWIAAWSSHHLPSGQYRISSIADDHADHTERSEQVVVNLKS
jgi:hypothetical protein